jgi:hypothetical protein
MGDSCTEFGTYPAETSRVHSPPHETRMTQRQSPWSGNSCRGGPGGAPRGKASQSAPHGTSWSLHPPSESVVLLRLERINWTALGPDRVPRLRASSADSSPCRRQSAGDATLSLKVAEGSGPPAAPGERTRYAPRIATAETWSRSRGTPKASRESCPVYVTAPSNHVAGQRPGALLRRHVRTLADVIPLHKQYVAADPGRLGGGASESAPFWCATRSRQRHSTSLKKPRLRTNNNFRETEFIFTSAVRPSG